MLGLWGIEANMSKSDDKFRDANAGHETGKPGTCEDGGYTLLALLSADEEERESIERVTMTPEDVSYPHLAIRQNLNVFFREHLLRFPTKLERMPLDLYVGYCLGRSQRTFDAVGSLVENGFFEDAAVLCRGLVETFISLRWVLQQDSLERARRFFEWEDHYARRVKKALVHHVPDLQLPGHLESVEDTGFRHKWSGESLKKMAEAAGVLTHYDLDYAHLCDLDHGNIMALDHYVENDFWHEMEGRDCSAPPKYDIEALYFANKYFLLILQEISGHFEVAQETAQAELRERVENACLSEAFLEHLWHSIESCGCGIAYTVYANDYNVFTMEYELPGRALRCMPVQITMSQPRLTSGVVDVNQHFADVAAIIMYHVHQSLKLAGEHLPDSCKVSHYPPICF
jgi:hypothetical protein